MAERILSEGAVVNENLNEAAAHADDGVEAGREWVEAYVDYTHFIERIHGVLSGAAHGEAESHAAH